MSETTVTKTCSKCKTSKPRTEFRKRSDRKDGHRSHCKTCQRIYESRYEASDERKAAKKTYNVSYNATYATSPETKAARKLRDAMYAKLYPNKIKAKNAVNNAITAGRLRRPDTLTCTCDQPAEQYHHWKGYAPEQWLDVIALCISCHRRIHHY